MFNLFCINRVNRSRKNRERAFRSVSTTEESWACKAISEGIGLEERSWTADSSSSPVEELEAEENGSASDELDQASEGGSISSSFESAGEDGVPAELRSHAQLASMFCLTPS